MQFFARSSKISAVSLRTVLDGLNYRADAELHELVAAAVPSPLPNRSKRWHSRVSNKSEFCEKLPFSLRIF